MNKDVEYVVIGAGVIGLAIARRLVLDGHDVLVLERNASVGEETSFRNSAVAHAGIYYSPHTLKAKFCKSGQESLYEYCKNKKIAFKKIGKLIVATDKDHLSQLQFLYNNAKIIGVNDLEFVDQKKLLAMEPAVHAVSALFSPSTGIIDGRGLIKNLQADVIEHGGQIACGNTFIECKKSAEQFIIEASHLQIKTRFIINSAGLYASDVASKIAGTNTDSIPKAYFAKGNYFKYLGNSPFSHLIYPIPEQAGLGIHATNNMQGGVRFGPDVEWINQPEFNVNTARKKYFVNAIKKYFPDLDEDLLQPDLVGVRPKILPAHEQPQDFLIQTDHEHGNKNLINLYGIESPGLTSCFVLADYVKNLIQ